MKFPASSKSVSALLIASVLALCGAPAASAATSIVANEAGGNVTIVITGSINLTSWQLYGTEPIFAYVAPRVSRIVVGAPATPFSDASEYINPTNFQSPSSFGAGGGAVANSGSGGLFGIWGSPSPLLWVPVGYVSGNPVNASMTFTGATCASLGMEVGTFTWSWGDGASADSMTLQVVPEPVSMQLVAISVIGLVLRRSRASLTE